LSIVAIVSAVSATDVSGDIGRASTAAVGAQQSLLSLQPNSIQISQAGPVLVTGATGRTGSLLFLALQNAGIKTRAFVRNITKAKEVLGCQACDKSEV
jgi:hypothetical protein